MLLGRMNELQNLNNVYARQGSQLVVVYGQKNIGKTVLINEFIKDKDALYYLANEASERQHLYLIAKHWQKNGLAVSEYPDYNEVFESFSASAVGKKVLVIDEFQHLVKAGSAFMEALVGLLHQSAPEKQFMIVLCSSSIGFVENGLVRRIGRAALEINSFLKVKELHFSEVRKQFAHYSVHDCILIYSLFGGIPGMWNYIDPSLSMQENICRNILGNGCFLKEEGLRLVKEELREGAVYYSILAALAEGKDKLNDLYKHTGFSRAKISVYLKNLMELEIVEKAFSFDASGHDQQRKGIYKISNHFVHFWFRYLYNHYSDSVTMRVEDFYEQFIGPSINEFCIPYFSQVCREYMQNLALGAGAPYRIEKQGFFDGKHGYIDYVGLTEGGERIVAFCDYLKPMFTYEDYLSCVSCLEQSKIKADRIYLFASGKFDEKLTLEAKFKASINLIGVDEL